MRCTGPNLLHAAMVNKETQVSMHPTVLSKAYTSLHFGDKEGNKHRLNDYTDSKICQNKTPE